MKSLRVALTRPTSLYKGGNGEEFESLCLFNIQKKGTGKNPIPLLSNHYKIDFLFIFNRNINPKIIFSFWIQMPQDYTSKLSLLSKNSFIPIITYPLSSLRGLMLFSTTTIFLKESLVFSKGRVSCSHFSSSGILYAD